MKSNSKSTARLSVGAHRITSKMALLVGDDETEYPILTEEGEAVGKVVISDRLAAHVATLRGMASVEPMVKRLDNGRLVLVGFELVVSPPAVTKTSSSPWSWTLDQAKQIASLPSRGKRLLDGALGTTNET